MAGWAEKPYDLSEVPVRLNHHDASLGADYGFIGGYTVYIKPGLTAQDVSVAENALNRFIDIRTHSAEVDALKDAYAARNDAREPAIVAAVAILDPNSLPKNGGCPFC